MDNHNHADHTTPPPPEQEKSTRRFSKIRTLADVRQSHGLFSRLLNFLRRTWLDWLTLVAVGIVTAGLWTVHSTRVRYFPITFTNTGDIVYPSLAYPYVEPIFSSAVAGVLAALIPIICFLLCQLDPRVRSFDDFTYAVLGLGYSLVTGTFFQVVLKKSIGGFRPHFLSVCEPLIPEATGAGSGAGGSGFQSVMYTSDICTGDPDRIQNAMESFPSGHSQIAFAGFLYLAIYLNAHLRVFSLAASPMTRRPSHWKMLAVIAPVLLATYLSSTLVLGHHHHFYDVIFGGLVGSGMSIWAYKMVFVSLWDGRTNCVTLASYREEEAVPATNGVGAHAGDEVLPTSRPGIGHGV